MSAMGSIAGLTPLVTPVGTFVPIPGGPFQMGSTRFSDAKPVRTIYVSTFYMGETAVTNQQFDAFRAAQLGGPRYALQAQLASGGTTIVACGDDATALVAAHYQRLDGLSVRSLELLEGAPLVPKRALPKGFDDPDQPATGVDWQTAHGYAVWAGEQVALATGQRFVGRLAREAEWEKTARGGIGAEYAIAGKKLSKQLACYATDRLAKVKSYPLNPLAYPVYDLTGGVWEWCEDWYGPYDPRVTRDPIGPESGVSRVARGGSWSDYAPCLRVGYRYRYHPACRYSDIGLRVVVRLEDSKSVM